MQNETIKKMQCTTYLFEDIKSQENCIPCPPRILTGTERNFLGDEKMRRKGSQANIFQFLEGQ